VNQFNSSEDISSTEIKELLIELDNNSVSDKIFNLSNATQFEKEIVSEYYQSNILKYYSIEISSIVEKIRNHYQSQLGTSINNNNNYQILICKYAEFECFIERNSIPYRHFTNFLDIVNLFIEGAILSYSLNEYQPNKLNHFDDYILEQIILYGNPEKITTLFNQHIKSGIKYRKTDDVSDCKKRIIYFLENFLEIEANFIKESYLLNSKARIYKTLWNIIITLSIIEFDDDFVRACSNFLLPIINGVPDNQKYSLNHFASFIKLKGNIINTKLLKNIYSTCLSNKILHNENLLLAFVSINNGNPPILVNDINSLNSFIEIFFDKCKTCNSIHIDILPQSYKVLNLKNRKSVKKIILEKLHSHFSAQLYYNACLFDIIKYDRYFEKYINLFSPPLQNEINNRHSLRDETFLSGLNELMNLVFKYKIELPKSFIEKFKGVSNYYDWLLDMDNFDYSKFNALWILQYATIHYLEHIFSNEKVKNETKKYLRSNFQPTISNYYAIYENC
jgi:hypothetical protein